MIYMTLIQIIYLGHVEFFETSFAKSLEIINESVFVLIQYNMVLLVNLVDSYDVKKQCGNTMVSLTGYLIISNMVVIIYVSLKDICRKCYLKRLRHKSN